jgi:hypothetical protein
VTWRELAGDGRLARALEACEKNGWEALPLAAVELARLFPELWGTEKAVELWSGNNPLNPYISIIRLWGVIHLYRPKGRRGKWSKALIRHGADPRVALAAVLGVTAEDIRVRKETAGSEPAASANTVPSPRSTSNPNPNTATEQPSNAGPGFPFGDN